MSSALWKPWPDDPAARAARPTRMFRGAFGDPLDPARFNAWNIFARAAAYAKQDSRAGLRLAVGDRDFPNLQTNNRDFVAELSARGVPVPLIVDEGAHDWSLWARQLPDMLAWLGTRWRTDAPEPSCEGAR